MLGSLLFQESSSTSALSAALNSTLGRTFQLPDSRHMKEFCRKHCLATEGDYIVTQLSCWRIWRWEKKRLYLLPGGGSIEKWNGRDIWQLAETWCVIGPVSPETSGPGSRNMGGGRQMLSKDNELLVIFQEVNLRVNPHLFSKNLT